MPVTPFSIIFSSHLIGLFGEAFLRILWEKYKVLVTRIFPFSNHRFCGVNSFTNKPWYLCVCSTGLLKTLWEKEKLLMRSNFSFSDSVFYSLRQLSDTFIKFHIVICKFFQFERV